MPMGRLPVSSYENPAGLESVIQRTAKGLPDLPTSSGTLLSNKVVDLLLASSVVTTRWMSLAFAAEQIHIVTAIEQSALQNMASLPLCCSFSRLPKPAFTNGDGEA
jgi:hypothetical protein